MHTKYTQLISTLTQKLSKEDIKAIQSSKNTDPKYLELLKVYLPTFEGMNIEDEIESFKTVNNYEKGKDGFNDLQENLYKHLTKYLKDKYYNAEKGNREIKSNIETAIALLEFGIYDGTEHYLKKTYKLLKLTKPSNSNWHYYLQYLNTLPVYLDKSETTFNNTLFKDFENIETLNYLNNIAINAANRLIPAGDLSKINFSANSLLELFADYFKRKNSFDKIYKVARNFSKIDFSFINGFTPSIREVDKLRIQDSFEYLMILEAVYAAYKLKDINVFNDQIGILFSHIDKWKQNNYQLYAFVMIHTWSLQLAMQVECQYPFDEKFFNVLERDFSLYTDSEIDLVSFRIELNKARVHMLSGNYLKAYAIFKGFGNTQTIPNETKLNILLSEHISYLFGSINAHEVKITEQLFNEINKIKAKKNDYLKSLLKFVEEYNSPKKFITNLKGFRAQNKPETLEDKIFDICFGNVLKEHAML